MHGFLQRFGHFSGVRGERLFAVGVRVIGARLGDGAYGGLALDGDVFCVVIHFEERFSRFDDLPDDDRRDLDRVGMEVVHFELLRFEVANAQRDGAFA